MVENPIPSGGRVQVECRTNTQLLKNARVTDGYGDRFYSQTGNEIEETNDD